MEAFYNERFLTFSLKSLSVWTWMLPVVLGLIWRSFLPTSLRWLFALCIFSIVFEYFSAMPWALQRFPFPTNYPYYHFLTPVLFWFHLKIFHPVLSRYFSDKVTNGFLLAFVVFCGWNAIWGDGILAFNGNTLAVLSLSCILIGAAYFIHLLRHLSADRPELSAYFWLSVGTVVYYAGSFLLWLAVEYINFSREEFDSFYDIHSALSILLHLTYCLAMWATVFHQDQDLLTMHS